MTAETLGSAGELAVLRRIFPLLPVSEAQLVGPGDDAAVLAAPDGRFVVTTDMMVHGPDFRLGWSTASDLGAKAVASNLSDIAAMGAVPTGIVVAIAAPLDTPVAFLEEFAAGMSAACHALSPGCGVVGGDLSVSDTLTIVVTAFGDLDGHPPVLRSGARVGDTVAVSGQLGVAGAGLWLLFSQGQSGEVGRYRNPDVELAVSLRREHPELIEAQLAPSPEIALGQLANQALASAMLDVSDGLILDARRICLASGVGMELDPVAIDREAARLRGIDPLVGDAALDLVLTGGEDHVLLATFPVGVAVPPPFRIIGRVVEGTEVRVGSEPYVKGPGWDPFTGWDGRTG